MVFHISCFCCGRNPCFCCAVYGDFKRLLTKPQMVPTDRNHGFQGFKFKALIQGQIYNRLVKCKSFEYSHHVLFPHQQTSLWLLREFFMFGYRNDPYLHDFMHEASPIRYLYRQVNYYSVPSSQSLGLWFGWNKKRSV